MKREDESYGNKVAEYQEATRNRLRRARRISFLVSIMMLVLGFAWLLYSGFAVQRLEREKDDLQRRILELENQLQPLQKEVDDLLSSQLDVLNFLENVTAEDNIQFVDPLVDWDATKSQIVNLQAGQRKSAILASILLSWKQLPFTLGGASPSQGFDSSTFVKFILEQVGIEVEVENGEFPSEAMIRIFDEVEPPERPLAGDLIFYQGQQGNFIFIYLAAGAEGGQGIGIGHLQGVFPISIRDTRNVRTELFPFRGYYRPKYTN